MPANYITKPRNLLDIQLDDMRSLVIGGVGFLGSHIVEALKKRTVDHEQVIGVFDLVKPTDEVITEVKYYEGDIVDQKRLTEVLKTVS